MSRNLIVSTCGTSVLTNRIPSQPDPPACLNQHTNAASPGGISPVDRKAIADHIAQREVLLENATVEGAKRLSAELNGVISYCGGTVSGNHILIHTDTWLGDEAARLIENKLSALGADSVESYRVPKLSTRSLQDFNEGAINLVEWAATTLPGYRDSQYHVVFNLVGGFKSVQGFMQTIGMFYADESIYIFETASELLRIPRLPVNLEDAARKLFEERHSLYRLFCIGQVVPSTDQRIFGIPDTLLFHFDGECDWSPWGKLLWENTKPGLYQFRLLDPPTHRIRFTDAFRKHAERAPKAKLATLNERIDDLARWLLSPDHPNLKRLDVKELRGNPRPPSTHEADAWADADCRRLFFHHEGDTVVLDRLDSPLH